MKNAFKMSRRSALIGAATLPAAALGRASAARAGAPMMGGGTSTFNRFRLGDFEVTALLAGTRTVEGTQGIFGMNVSEEEFAQASAAAHIPADKAQFFFTPTVVNTGTELILFDTGLNGAGIVGALASAGYMPDQVDTVVLTHMHGDHIGGLMTDGSPTFKNARYITGSVEHNHWSGTDNEGFANNVVPLNDQIAFLDDGGSIASGITAVAAFGHTPGHMGYMLESGGSQLMLTADLANHYVWSLAYPDWEVRFDIDKAMAAQSRRKVLGMLAADKVPFIGYHMPWPALGYVDTRDDGFHYVPATYQLMMD